jgi:inosose dehydratase
VNIAVQTRPWGPERNRNDLTGILSEIAGAGYDGFEIGAQHLDLDHPSTFRQLLDDHGLDVVGVHVGGEIYDPKSVADALANLGHAVEFAAAVGASFLPFSGKMKENKSETEMRNQADSLNKIGALAKDAGLTLAYHNHFWEIQEGAAELHYLMDNTDPAIVSFCLDVAWVYRGGGDPAAVVTEMLETERIGYFHLKDTTEDEWKELGRGVVDLPAIMGVIEDHGYDGWLVVEQDETQLEPVESARISRDYLRETFNV